MESLGKKLKTDVIKMGEQKKKSPAVVPSRSINWLFLLLLLLLIVLFLNSLGRGTARSPVVTEGPAVEPAPSVIRETAPQKTPLTRMNTMEEDGRIMVIGSTSSTRNDHFDSALSCWREGYIIYCLNQDYDELTGSFCVHEGGFLENEVTLEFIGIDENRKEYRLPVSVNGEAYTTLRTDGYCAPKEFSVDVRGIDMIKIVMHGYYADRGYGEYDSSALLGDPVLIKY